MCGRYCVKFWVEILEILITYFDDVCCGYHRIQACSVLVRLCDHQGPAVDVDQRQRCRRSLSDELRNVIGHRQENEPEASGEYPSLLNVNIVSSDLSRSGAIDIKPVRRTAVVG